jgi:hypothetical protein
MLGLGETRLSIYLNDHLAGATGVVNLAREIDEDRSTLVTVMDRLSVGRDQLKLALAWGAERAGRLKLHGSLVGYSPLSRLEELEAVYPPDGRRSRRVARAGAVAASPAAPPAREGGRPGVRVSSLTVCPDGPRTRTSPSTPRSRR